jgi:hypothetical protein
MVTASVARSFCCPKFIGNVVGSAFIVTETPPLNFHRPAFSPWLDPLVGGYILQEQLKYYRSRGS